ncbi:hypothetical protein H112_07654 [Trichophyton rubrum D6]|uniref:Uncharacterized protein n=3 Tax=Trichophyton TaxID=5550 RepID=F2SET4_TRIRC|nr:uncharacterized protein TERG_00252 [Trichophyton rubrum CBS 118892]EZF11239.1 hypothetical protein H100_07679 [Trichophyton rubrum MR850]EZF38104.1 hypothetical protein H102_07644 [Trichophyton rubrum CBS 100081]EZF48743.1 hypothetical protein H103_07667 [Trichophyton rubrum CBS 288.86]EZF59441.1 hypothetical protein H104_07615 [Trichophyton rubrum CBS 289.86]EZF69981.1 hypothetical protein H105_07670 [Trichophyton soudanense CBS 452.61]EZF80675.1 hypothetical protein H110_07664 [Trichophy
MSLSISTGGRNFPSRGRHRGCSNAFRQDMDNTLATPQAISMSLTSHTLAIGNPGDVDPSHDQVTAIVGMLLDSDICCCIVHDYALIYYGARANARDRVLCVPDAQLEKAVEIFTSNHHILEPCEPFPLRRPGSLDHRFPRFKAVGRTDFWLLLPASSCHFICEPENIEWSQGCLPYPKLHVNTQSLIDTINRIDLAALVDGMDLSEEWGIEHLDLEGNTDTEWRENMVKCFGKDSLSEDDSILAFSRPVSRQGPRKEFVLTKESRMSWNQDPLDYTTRFLLRNSKGPRMRRGLGT